MTACAFLCTDADHMHDCTCNRCGRRVRVRRLPVNAECAPAPGLGDRVAAALDSAGITKERVAAALGVKDCGCQQRQQWLNEVGYRIGIGTPNPDHTGTTDLDAHG